MERARGGIRASKKVETLLLPASDFSAGPWEPANSSCFLMEFVKGLLQEFCQAQDSKTIAIEI